MKKVIPRKNYFIIVGLIIAIFCACLAIYNLYIINSENNIKNSPLALNKININDMNNSVKDMASDTMLFISYNGDKRIYKNEKEIYEYLEDNLLLDNIIYLDVTDKYYSDISDNHKDLISLLNKNLRLKNKNILNELPAVVYFRDGMPLYSIDSSKKILNKKNIKKIVDNYILGE